MLGFAIRRPGVRIPSSPPSRSTRGGAVRRGVPRPRPPSLAPGSGGESLGWRRRRGAWTALGGLLTLFEVGPVASRAGPPPPGPRPLASPAALAALVDVRSPSVAHERRIAASESLSLLGASIAFRQGKAGLEAVV